MSLTARILRTGDLSASHVDEMYALMDRHYDNVWRDRFEADLSEKDWVIRLTHEQTGRLCGFSTQRLLSLNVQGRPITVVFSGDTIVERRHWGTTALPIAWGRLAFSIIDDHPEEELYWCLISKGFRTYRFLPLFFEQFYPRYDADTPLATRAVIDAIAGTKYPDRYDPAAGVIRATATSDRLRPDLGEASDAKRRDPHVEFFHARNPGHVNGDELCCIAPLTPRNFSSSAWKLIRSPRFVLQTVG